MHVLHVSLFYFMLYMYSLPENNFPHALGGFSWVKKLGWGYNSDKAIGFNLHAVREGIDHFGRQRLFPKDKIASPHRYSLQLDI